MSQTTTCHSVEGTTNCLRTTDADDPAKQGWVIVHGDWWCANCQDRYGFVPDNQTREPEHEGVTT